MYLDMGNMKSYNKGHGCEQPYVTCTLIPSPLSVSYIYIYLNTERFSSGVRINDLANGLKCATFLILVCHDKGEKFFRSNWTERCKRDEMLTSTSSPPQDL